MAVYLAYFIHGTVLALIPIEGDTTSYEPDSVLYSSRLHKLQAWAVLG